MLRAMSQDLRGYSPSTARNREPILQVLREVLPERGSVLEIASGTGEHITYFAQRFPGIQFQPSDVDPKALQSIIAWVSYLQLSNVAPPLSLDAITPWPPLSADVVLNMNMIHIAPWEVCLGLMMNTAKLLSPGGLLFLYGPFRINGVHTAASNENFDKDLRSRNPLWGVRDLEAVEAAANNEGLSLEKKISMPANNLSLLFYKR
jgi:SAM-dependent methyltransferase